MSDKKQTLYDLGLRFYRIGRRVPRNLAVLSCVVVLCIFVTLFSFFKDQAVSPPIDLQLPASTVFVEKFGYTTHNYFPHNFDAEFLTAASKGWWHLGCVADTGRILGILRLFAPKEKEWIIDIGANEGQTTEDIFVHFGNIPFLRANKKLGNKDQYCKDTPNPGVNVLVVEPVPQNMETIKKRSELNGWALENVKFIEKATSTKNGEITFFIGKGSEVGSLGKNSNSKGTELTVDTVTLDKLIKDNVPKDQLFLLKIDTEGFDGEIMKASPNVFKDHIAKFLIFEYHKFWQDAGTTTLKEIIDLLEEFNYFCFFIFDKRLLPLSGEFWKTNYEIRQWSNVLCGHEQKIMFKIAKIYHLAYSSENFANVYDWLFEQ